MIYEPSEHCQRMHQLREASRRRTTFAQVVGRYTTLMLLCYAAIGLAAAYWL